MKLNSAFKKDKGWSDLFLPEIKSILGLCLISEPPIEEDTDRNTDLMVLRLDAIRIGCRMRKNKYLGKCGDEFTIRSGRPSGVKTELTKIIEGWGDYFFYGFADKNDLLIDAWVLCDLRVFRIEFNRKLVKMGKGDVPGISINNKDNSSVFTVFKLNEFPPEFIVARKLPDSLQEPTPEQRSSVLV